jgi:MFS family permease
MTASADRASRLADYFALNRNVAAASGTVFLMSLGENLWRKFLPKYLENLGAPIPAIGLFGTFEDFLDGVYQYPGGWLADRLGRRAALVLFIAIASGRYLIYWLAPTRIFLGLLFAMAFEHGFADALFHHWRRALAPARLHRPAVKIPIVAA